MSLNNDHLTHKMNTRSTKTQRTPRQTFNVKLNQRPEQNVLHSPTAGPSHLNLIETFEPINNEGLLQNTNISSGIINNAEHSLMLDNNHNNQDINIDDHNEQINVEQNHNACLDNRSVQSQSRRRKELEIKLLYARKKQKYMDEVLRLEEAVELEKLNISDDETILEPENFDIDHVQEWVQNSIHNTNESRHRQPSNIIRNNYAVSINHNQHQDERMSQHSHHSARSENHTSAHHLQRLHHSPRSIHSHRSHQPSRSNVSLNNHHSPFSQRSHISTRSHHSPCSQRSHISTHSHHSPCSHHSQQRYRTTHSQNSHNFQERCLPNPSSFQDDHHKNDNMKNLIIRQSVPKELPIFSGNPLDWPNFIAQFRNSSKICSFSDYENQIRLDKCLKGKAREIVQALLIYPQNVERIINVLENRFGRPEYIINLLLEKVRSFNPIKDEKINALIEFSDIVCSLVYTLESLNEIDHIRNPILYSEVLNKLPISHRLSFIEHCNISRKLKPCITDLQMWLQNKVNAVCQILPPFICEEKSSKSKAMTFAISENVGQKILKSQVCIFCDSNDHKIIHCEKFKLLSVDDRWSFVTSKYICFCCLTANHSLKTCRQRKYCAINDCKKFHNPLLHKTIDSNSTSNYIPPTIINATNCNVNQSSEVLLKIIPVELQGPNCILKTYALLDEGSTVSLIDESFAKELGLEGPVQPLRIQWTNNQFNEQKNSMTVSVSIKGCQNSNSKWFTLRHVKTTNNLALPFQTVDMNKIKKHYPYLENFSDISFEKGKPMILLGQDNWPVIVTRKNIGGFWNGPTMSKTYLGWVIHGCLNFTNESKVELKSECLFNHVHNTDTQSNFFDDLDQIQNMIKHHWSIEIIGIESEKEYSLSLDDKKCISILDHTVRKVHNKYESGLFWKDENSQLPESYSNAYRRLLCLEQKMTKNHVFGESYTNKFNEYVAKGYIKKLNKNEASLKNNHLWYLPHFGIVNPNKPKKLRIVFDAASKVNGKSLNDYLLSGPDLYNSLPTLLINFRKHRIAFVGDIKEMFLQILIREKDRFCQRLLWRNNDQSKTPDIYEIQVLFFGAKCSPCIAQDIKNRNARENIDEFPAAAYEIINRHYMDDYLGGADSTNDAIKLISDVIKVHSKGGFEICNWVTNSEEVLSHIPENLRAQTMKDIQIESSNCEERILGVWWDFKQDHFRYQFKFLKIDPDIIHLQKRPTKRDILKIIMSIFDPLGFISNFLIIGKILMQSIWISGISWDEFITDNQYQYWQNWSHNFENISRLKIPRVMTTFPIKNCNTQLHLFCDASEQAYATVAYLRFEFQGQIQCTLINSKARVAPLKPLSVPRMELQAALIGARLSKYLLNSFEFKINDLFLWTDSKIVLYWIKSNSKRMKTYVAQRIGEIQELTNPSRWFYVPTDQNIADDATKLKDIEINSDSYWFHGPLFLYKSIPDWPKSNYDENEMQNVEINEIKNTEFVGFSKNIEENNFVIPDVQRFSNWNIFLRASARIFQFINLLKGIKNKNLELENIQKAEIHILRKTQNDSFSEELNCLKNNRAFSRNSKLNSFSCKIDDDGLLRVHGRLDNSEDLNYNTKYPIILDAQHGITKLIVKYYHECNNHQGVETIISKLREKYWITNIRNTVKFSFYNCQFCKNLKAKPQIPKMGQLPKCRVDRTLRPFSKSGVDFFGPFDVLVNRKHQKRYGVLFTCMTIRAIHLEIAEDLSSSTFIHILRQFSARRGFPDELYSDNGTNFRKADKDLKQAFKNLESEELTQFCLTNNCKWFFNPPSAPHMGGSWERLIQSVKKHLKIVMMTKCPKEFVLRTIFCEIENIINSRPLTYNSDDINDPQPITPNHFLIGPSYSCFKFVESNDKDLILVNMWKASQRILDCFWKQWSREYIPNLLVNRKWIKENKNIAIGDFVLIMDSDGPRNVWPKGRVVKVFPAKDGCIRVVDVKTCNGIFRRPVCKIIKLDILKNSNSIEN